MSDYKDYYNNILNDTLKNIQSLVSSGFGELYSIVDDLNDILKESDILKKRIEYVKEENEDLKNRIKELEELLKIAKERD